ncbi:MAG TPA: RdgB/HAM1 family non-canonical purine NTP pyrophosphatase [Longilinea sp.]|nr:RdgB/HAM1 family non-canonical purine NTP pyrophosphatase [Longilinea sp.]
MPLSILIATNNPGKRRELSALLDDLPIRLLLPADIGLSLDVEEDGNTYAENAAKKAVAFCQVSGLTVVADDSGLEVDALGGAPGLHSARLAPGGDADRRRRLLQLLAPHPRPWNAHFHCTLAVAQPGLPIHFFEGDCPGEIIPEERGEDGFGFDPIFLVEGMNMTMGELSMDEKNQLSHRARAVKAAKPLLRTISHSPSGE